MISSTPHKFIRTYNDSEMRLVYGESTVPSSPQEKGGGRLEFLKTLPLEGDFAGREIRAVENNEILTEHIKAELLGSLRKFEKAELEFLAGLETFTSHESIVSNVTTRRPGSR